MAETTSPKSTGAATAGEEGRTPSAAKIADVGRPTPASMRALAEDLPTRDKVQQAYKDAMLAESAQDEAKAKAVIVDESPDAADTPSGAALKKVTGIANDTERGEEYLREKTAHRWGYAPVEP